MERTAVVGAAIVRHGQVLAARRSYPPTEAGRWEFPGGKVDPPETPEASLVREVAEELGCRVELDGWLPGTNTTSGRCAANRPLAIELQVGVCRLIGDEPTSGEHDALRWLGPEQLDEVDWLDADRPFLPALREVLLEGLLLPGNVGGAVRIGATVRRPTGPWTPAVHALLAHLAARGVPGVPSVHGLDARGREVLDFLPGTVIDVDTEQLGDAQLWSLGRWTAGFHAAVADFTHPGPWRFFGADAPTLIAHNDLAPYNLCFTHDQVSGVIDWDLAGPSTPLLELAHTAWSAIPLFRPRPPAEVADRLRLLADGYGRRGATEILAAVPARVQLAINGIQTAAAAGDVGMANLMKRGEPGRTQAALAGFLERLSAIRAELRR